MESQGSSRQPEDQLQGIAVQDQELQPVTSKIADRIVDRIVDRLPDRSFDSSPKLTPQPFPDPSLVGPGAVSASATRIVVRLPDRIVKGYLEGEGGQEDRIAGLHDSTLLIRSFDTGESESIPLAEAKAIFFVRNFDGTVGHSDLRFHDHLPPPQSLWIRLVFHDEEVLEGMIENGPRYVLDPGFLVTPTDPTANNWLIYVPKSQVRRFEVLGLRQRTATRLTAPR